jgi:hypothetical protein
MGQNQVVVANFDEQAGRRLLQELDKRHFPIDAALWLYRPEEDDWRLMLATPLVDEFGPSEGYRRLQRVVQKVPGTRLSLSNVELASPEDPFITLLRSAISTGPGIHGVRFSRNSINGVFIEDAYIYRLLPLRKKRQPA